MSFNALNIIPVKTDSCPKMDKQAVNKKMAVTWGNHKFGDIVLFDFNKNGTADHIGIVIATGGSSIVYTVEGNTGSGNNTNGGQVQARKRTRSTIKRFARPKYSKTVTPAMIVYTALGEVGTVESPRNSNKVKYNRWFYGKNISAFWCCTFVCWLYGNVSQIPKVKRPSGVYSGKIPTGTIKYGSSGDGVKTLQKFLNWYHKEWKLAIDGNFGPKTMRALMVYQNTEDLTVDGVFGAKSAGRAKKYKTAPVTTKPTTKPTKPAAKPSTKPTTKPTAKPAKPKPTLKSYKIVVDLTNQICTVYGIYSDESLKPIMSEFVSTARKGCTTPVGNWKIQGASGGRKAKLRTAKMSSGKAYAEFLCRFKGAKCLHTVPYSKRQTTGHVSKSEFNKLGTPRSAGCVRMPWKMAHYIYANCPVGTPVSVIKGKAGEYPKGIPTKYHATTDIDPTYKK